MIKTIYIKKMLYVLMLTLLGLPAFSQSTLIPVPSHNRTYTGYTRGFYFTAPVDMYLTHFKVPVDANSTAKQAITVLKFSGTPSTGNGTLLGHWPNIAAADSVDTVIFVEKGDVVGILGNRWTSNGYFDAINSYANGTTTTINGTSVSLSRFGYQDNIAAGKFDASVGLITGTGTSEIGRVLVYWSPNPPERKLNDVGVSAVDSPTTFCSGTKDIWATIKNYGINQVDSVNVNWSLNGTTQTAVKYKSTLDTFGGQGSNSAMIKLGSHSFQSGKVVDIEVWTSDPNGATDSVTANDSILVKRSPSLSGTFSVGGTNPDFATPADAAQALSSYGVCGPVVLNIAPGTYTGQLELIDIAGVSSTNTVTFAGPSSGSSKAIIRHTGSGTADMATVLIDKTDYITFKNLVIEARGSSYGVGFLLTGQADYNQILDNEIKLSTSSSNAYTIGILMTGSSTSYSTYGENGNYNLIKGNLIEGGYYGMRIQGSSTSNMDMGNRIISNTFDQQYYYGLYAYYEDGIEIIGNTFDNFRNTYNYGIYCNYPANFKIQRNYINNYYYLRVYYGNRTNYNGSVRSEVSNNMVVGQGSYTLYSYYTENTNYYHNTFHSTSGSYGSYIYYNSEVDYVNNIFSKQGSNYLLYIYRPNNVKFDYNNYFTNSGTIAYINDGSVSIFSTLSDWRSSYAADNANSHEVDPDFKSGTDLHIANASSALYGENIGIKVDLDGDARCVFSPTIGSDEVPRLYIPPTANFAKPDTLWMNSTALLLSNQSLKDQVLAKWYVNGKEVSDSIHLEFTPPDTGAYELKLVLTNCGGSDSVTKTVNAYEPLRKPEADFTVSARTPYIDEAIKLMDLSDNGPTTWAWDISPKTYYNPFLGIYESTYEVIGGDDTSKAFPKISFNAGGFYTICLTATNAFGSDQVCRTQYIEVKDRASMCQLLNESSAALGTLYDDGGPLGSYSSGVNGNNLCNYLITQCNGELDLSFSEFELEDKDYIRIYDGLNSQGTPLWDVTNYPDGMTGDMMDASFKKSLRAESGSAYIQFESDDNTSTVASGFALDWKVIPTTFTTPSANFSMPDTACTGLPVTFVNTTSTGGLLYSWGIAGIGTELDYSKDFVYTFGTSGTYDVELIVESNCAGSDTITKTIVIEDAQRITKPSMTVSNRNVNVGDTLSLMASSNYCVSGYRWEFYPANAVYFNGTTPNDQTIDIGFTKGGSYHVKLLATNPAGKDSIIDSNAIWVLEYCTPVSANLDGDVAISRVVFNTIDHSSDVGQSVYSNFSNVARTTVERGHTYALKVERNSAVNRVNRKVWFDWNNDGDFVDMNELVASHKSSKDTNWMDSIYIPVNASAGNIRMRVGITYKQQSLDPCGPLYFGEFEDYGITIESRDLTAPTLTLNGAVNDTIEVFDQYMDPGYSASDLIDGNLSSKVSVFSQLDTAVIGDYKITYSVTDGGNNTTVKERWIHVRDTKVPTISLNGDPSIYVEAPAAFVDPWVTYSDGYDQNPELTVTSNVDTTVLGTYTVNYCVVDGSGNGPVCVSRTVIVGDSTKPEIMLADTSHDTVEVYEFYPDPSFTASDNFDQNLTISRSGTWPGSPDEVGTFDLVITATDDEGNSASVTKMITVIDTENPVISLLGNLNDTVYRWGTYVDPLYTLSDNYSEASNISVQIGGDFESTTSIGSFYITYQATDESGNMSPILTRVVHVVEDVASNVSSIEDASLEIYPNPNTGRFVIQPSGGMSGRTDLKIFDVNGRLVYSNANEALNESGTELDLSHLEGGTYVLRVTSLRSGAVATTRMVIMK